MTNVKKKIKLGSIASTWTTYKSHLSINRTLANWGKKGAVYSPEFTVPYSSNPPPYSLQIHPVHLKHVLTSTLIYLFNTILD